MIGWFKRIPAWAKIVGGLVSLAILGFALSSLISPSPFPTRLAETEETPFDLLAERAAETQVAGLTLTSAYAAPQTFLAPTKNPEPTDTYTPTLEPRNTFKPVPTWSPNVPPTDASLGDTWIRPTDGAEMVYVQAGEFLMGSAEDAPNAYIDEKPQHAVALDAFWIDRYEVTNAQYAAFLNEIGNQEEGGITWLDLESGYCLIEEVDDQFQSKDGI